MPCSWSSRRRGRTCTSPPTSDAGRAFQLLWAPARMPLVRVPTAFQRGGRLLIAPGRVLRTLLSRGLRASAGVPLLAEADEVEVPALPEDCLGQLVADVRDLPQTQADGPAPLPAVRRADPLDGEAVLAAVDIDGQDRNAEQLRLLQDNVRGEEAGGLGRQEGGEVVGGVVGLEPGGLVDGAGELGCMALAE